jgi:hypothetical protein
LLQLVFKQEKKDVKQHKNRGLKPTQLTRDDAARITAEAVNAVLEKLSIRQIVEGIAVLPAGEGVWLVDVVMRDLAADSIWAFSLTIPPVQEQTDGLT